MSMRLALRPEGWLLVVVAAAAALWLGARALEPTRDPWRPGGASADAMSLGLPAIAAEAALHGEPAPALEPPVQVRLMRFEGATELALEIEGTWRMLDESGTARAEGSGLRGVLRMDPTGIQIGPYLSGLDRLVLATDGDGALRIADERYDGALEVGMLREGARATGLSLVLHLPLEDYVLGVVCGEMATTAHSVASALRAQAVAARSYALWKLRQRGGALRDTSVDQVFRGLDWHTAAAREAVASTRGIVLVWEDRLLPAFFHADCGGATADAAKLGFVPRSIGALSGSRDPGCESTPGWREIVAPERLDAVARALNLGTWLREIHALDVDAFGRMLRTRLLGEKEHFDGPSEETRVRLSLPSVMWTSARTQADGGLLVEGRGHGHGVGLCQIGAKRRARVGEDWRAILAHYYPGATLRSLTADLLDD